jgi:hypothetical protein
MYGPKMADLSIVLTFVRSECRILGTKWLLAQFIRDSVIFMILAVVSMSRK